MSQVSLTPWQVPQSGSSKQRSSYRATPLQQSTILCVARLTRTLKPCNGTVVSSSRVSYIDMECLACRRHHHPVRSRSYLSDLHCWERRPPSPILPWTANQVILSYNHKRPEVGESFTLFSSSSLQMLCCNYVYLFLYPGSSRYSSYVYLHRILPNL